MRLITDLNGSFPLAGPTTLTIGNFDGLHLGHLSLLKQMKERPGQKVALTFSNHPASVLTGKSPPLLISLEERLRLLNEWVDITLLIPFTLHIAHQTSEEFLANLRNNLPFSSLLLGHDACFGRDRGGCRSQILELSHKMGFSVDYVPPFQLEGTPVSSSSIRKKIEEGNLLTAERFLGRPYRLLNSVHRGKGRGKELGFPTLNLPVDGLIHPPFGIYIVHCLIENRSLFGVANLGHAPTLSNYPTPLLEIHLFDFDDNLYGQKVAVRFLHFLRSEKKFSSIESLREQIQKDCETAKHYLLTQESQYSAQL